jgi:glutathione S-transferase
MIILHTFGPYFGLPDPSPFVMKTEVQLKMSGLAYRTQPSSPQAAPKGKLPFIEDDRTVVADSVFIRAYLEKAHGVDLDPGLDARGKATAWAVERMLEDSLYWAIVHFRWVDEENFAKGPAQFFDAVPAPAREGARDQARQRVAVNLHGHGMGRHRREEIADLAARNLGALSAVLGDQPYLMGEAACGVDATAFAFFAAALCPLFESPLREAAECHANLVAYRDRMMRRYYPDLAPSNETRRALVAAV